jgi:hypothetical protein
LSRQFSLSFCIPVLAGFAFAGSSGLALSAVFAGLSGLFLAPCGDFFMFRRYRRVNADGGNFESRTLGDVLDSFRSCGLLAPVFLSACALISAAGKIHPLLVLAEGAGFAGIFLFSQRVLSRRGETQGHVRFAPVLIRKVPVKKLTFSRMMLPYVLASLIPALPFFPDFPSAGDASFLGEPDRILHEAEYRAHAVFQTSFSYRALGRGEPEGAAYFRYTLGDDGLIAAGAAGMDPPQDIPPFPLEDLMNFLETGGKVAPEKWNPFTLMNLIPVLAVFLLSLPAYIRPAWGDKKRKKRLLYKYKEKGIAA